MQAGSTIGLPFACKDASGVLRNADSTPGVVVLRNGDDTTLVPSVISTGTGLYKASIELPANWLAGDIVYARITAMTQGSTDVAFVRVGQITLSDLGGLALESSLATKASQASVTALSEQVAKVAADVADLQGLV